MIHIYYGFAKGKTTAAIGLGLRAHGAGMKVAMVQFLKDCTSSELKVLPFEVFKSPESLPFNPGEDYRLWTDSALAYIQSTDADMLILDEFLDVIPKFIDLQKALSLLEDDREIVVTGHNVPPLILEKGDYITHFEKMRHPYDKGVKARKGIEF